jgi:MSHA biogenesis protein MshP
MKSMSAMCHSDMQNMPLRRCAAVRQRTSIPNCRGMGKNDGFALVSAIFLLVVLAALGAFMVTMSTVQHTTSAQDVQGSRAYQAARAGIELGVYQIMAPENANYNRTVAPFTAQYTCAATPLNTLGGALAGFNVSIICTRANYTEGGNVVSVYQVTSNASLGAVGTTQYVARQLTATVSTCRKTADGEKC